jgi:hypothetical protein
MHAVSLMPHENDYHRRIGFAKKLKMHAVSSIRAALAAIKGNIH